MPLYDYNVNRDHFEDREDQVNAFPCCCCKHEEKNCREYPCNVCDHNGAADPESV